MRSFKPVERPLTFRDDKSPSDYNEEVKTNEAKDKGERKSVGGGAISRKRDQQKDFYPTHVRSSRP